MKWLVAVLCVVCLLAVPVDAGCHQGVQVFQAPAVQSAAVFAQPACAVQSVQAVQVPVVQQQVYQAPVAVQAVQVPVQASVIVQSAAYSTFAVPVVQQVVRRAPVRQVSRVRVRQRVR